MQSSKPLSCCRRWGRVALILIAAAFLAGYLSGRTSVSPPDPITTEKLRERSDEVQKVADELMQSREMRQFLEQLPVEKVEEKTVITPIP